MQGSCDHDSNSNRPIPHLDSNSNRPIPHLNSNSNRPIPHLDSNSNRPIPHLERELLAVIEPARIEQLPEELQRGLSPKNLLGREVEVVHEKDQALACRGAVPW